MNVDKKILRKLNKACNGDVSEIAEHIFADSLETVANRIATVESSKEYNTWYNIRMLVHT